MTQWGSRAQKFHPFLKIPNFSGGHGGDCGQLWASAMGLHRTSDRATKGPGAPPADEGGRAPQYAPPMSKRSAGREKETMRRPTRLFFPFLFQNTSFPFQRVYPPHPLRGEGFVWLSSRGWFGIATAVVGWLAGWLVGWVKVGSRRAQIPTMR